MELMSASSDSSLMDGLKFKRDVRALLDKTCRSEDTLDVSDVKQRCDLFGKHCPSITESKTLADLAFKELALQFSAMENSLPLCSRLLCLSLQCVKESMCSENLPCIIFSDLIDCLSLEDCNVLFSFLEQNLETLKSPMFFQSNRNHILRTCNDLQRRLSKSVNPQFCGRILMFLSTFFPSSDRSGINLTGQFHSENTTSYDKSGVDYFEQQRQQLRAKASATDDGEMETDDDDTGEIEEGEAVEGKGKPIDYAFYSKFWGMQDYFRDPMLCFNKKGWHQFVAHTNDVLSVFRSLKIEDAWQQRKRKRDGSAVSPCKDAVAAHSTQQQATYFAKYLTSQRLLELQLEDNKFRRSILTQLLVYLQYVSGKSKFKKEELELRAEQRRWVDDTTDTVYDLLQQVPPNGAAFVSYVRSVLRREEYWSAWKLGGCKDAVEDVMSSYEKAGKPNDRRRRKTVAEQMRQCHGTGRVVFGQNKELERVWNLGGDHMGACRHPSRKCTPSLQELLEEPILQLQPNSGVEERYLAVNDAKFQWQATRLLSTSWPHFFDTYNKRTQKKKDGEEDKVRQKDTQKTNSPSVVLTDILLTIGEQWASEGKIRIEGFEERQDEEDMKMLVKLEMEDADGREEKEEGEEGEEMDENAVGGSGEESPMRDLMVLDEADGGESEVKGETKEPGEIL